MIDVCLEEVKEHTGVADPFTLQVGNDRLQGFQQEQRIYDDEEDEDSEEEAKDNS